MTFKEALLAVAVGVMVYRCNKYKKEAQLWCADIESRLQALEATIEIRREPRVMGPPVSPFGGGAIKTCRDGYVLIDEDLDGVGACKPRSVDWHFNAGACRSSLGDHVGMASDLKGCWTLCSERYGANLKAIDLDSNNWCTCQDACECMDPGKNGGYYVMTSLEFANGLPAACETDETPPRV